MKTKSHLIILVTTIYLLFCGFDCNAQNSQNNSKNIQGFLSYKTYNKIDIIELYKSILQLQSLVKDGDSKNIKNDEKNILNLSDEEIKDNLIKSLKNLNDSHKKSPYYKLFKESIESLSYSKGEQNGLTESDYTLDYYFFQDTVRFEGPKMKTVDVPLEFKSYREAFHSGKTHRDFQDLGELFSNLKIHYKIEINRKDTKTILGYKGYKVVINEIRDDVHRVYELYISDEYNYPLNYYSFLLPRKIINYKGLVLECKKYDNSTPESYDLLRLINFNSKKQNHSLIEIDFTKYPKFKI